MSDVSVEEGWIVTLDVLKYLKGKVTFECLDSWIVTLDVLKSESFCSIVVWALVE